MSDTDLTLTALGLIFVGMAVANALTPWRSPRQLSVAWWALLTAILFFVAAALP